MSRLTQISKRKQLRVKIIFVAAMFAAQYRLLRRASSFALSGTNPGEIKCPEAK
jgi:hypothetical protein